MLLNAANGAGQAPSSLSVRKSTVIAWIAISLILVETFSGALRFFFDLAGISAVLYLPKVACVALFLLELCALKANRIMWLCLPLLLLSAALAMLHGASLNNLGFSLFIVGPLLFGLVCGEYLLLHRRLLGWVIGLCLLASWVGIGLDKFTVVPWKGYAYSLGEVELSANTAWSADSQDRIAGFARVSGSLSLLIAIYTLYLTLVIRSRVLWLLLCVASFYGILLTTSKAPAVAFIGTLALLPVLHFYWTRRILLTLAVLMGLALPLIGLMNDFDSNMVYSDSSLSSLYDRLINTWPSVIHAMEHQGWVISGAGFGLVGSSLAPFPVPDAQEFQVSDNAAIYLWCAFGVAGLLLYLSQIQLLFVLSDHQTEVGRALLSIVFCICLISWTTDVFESSIASLFIGVGISLALASREIATPSAQRPQDLPELTALPGLHGA
ncbi:O-antigen ligase family protein [Pseudomonas sp. Pseusp122]|uniref:O-antigen ligase family protein n=1 Tax=unclassified Pseudomonas TaxID=196821 RepID=UPI0039A606A5